MPNELDRNEDFELHYDDSSVEEDKNDGLEPTINNNMALFQIEWVSSIC